MRRILFAVFLLFATGGTAESAHVLWFPFDHYVTMTCGFGCYTDPAHHDGVDFACPEGTDLYASIDGTVINVTNNVPGQLCSPMNFGNYVKIQNDQGDMQTIHGHMLMGSIVVVVGQHVSAGQYLGESSNSGSTYNSQGECGQGGGYHLHLETRVPISGVWTPVDPYTYDGGLWTDPLLYGNQNPPTYACSPAGRTPSNTPSYSPGYERTWEMRFTNTGTNNTWSNNPSSPNYVELKSVCYVGNQWVACESFLNYPYDTDLGWVNSISPCTMLESTVSPGQTATFRFDGRVRGSAGPDFYQIYFRPNHATAGLLSGWGDAHFPINVVTTPDPNPAPDAIIAVKQSNTVQQWRACASNGTSSFGNWFELIPDFCDYTYRFYWADVNGDEFDDLLGVKTVNSTTMEWHLALSNGNGYLIDLGTVISDFGNSNSTFLTGDFNGDGKEDLAHGTPVTGDPTKVEWRVALSTGTGFASGSVWKTDFGDTGYRFFAGDFNGDGKCDLAHNHDENSTTVPWYVALSTGSSFGGSNLWSTDCGNANQVHLVGDFNGDGKWDAAHSSRSSEDVIAWYVTLSSGSAFGTSVNWKTDFGDDNSHFFARDMSRDGKCDLIHATAISTSQVVWHVAKSSGSAFGGSSRWKEDFGDSDDDFYVANVVLSAQGKLLVEEPDETDELEAPLTSDAPRVPESWVRLVPNPTHGQVKLWLGEPQITVTALQVFNLQGRLIRSITDPSSLEGNPLWWDGRTTQAERVPAGIYFLRITTPTRTLTRSVTVVR